MTAPSLASAGAGPALRVAWFSPMPPTASGIAAYSAELLPMLRASGFHIDVFVDQLHGQQAGMIGAHDFVWRHRRQPYDLVVYQLGNAACHEYMWGYLFRYPGLVVLHDAQVHQARAQGLLGRWEPRRDDYLEEFAWNHPDAPPDAARLVAEGLGGTLFWHWPHVRLVLRAARLVAVHSATLAGRLSAAHEVAVRTVPMGVSDPLVGGHPLTPADVRARCAIPADAIVVGAFGGLTPEKRLPQVIDAVAALAGDHPRLHLMLVGAAARHFDAAAYAAGAGIADRVHAAGFVADDELGAYLEAADFCTCLRWPSNGETSASWLRALAAGRPTIITDLAHQPEIPVLDPRNWKPTASRTAAPVAAAVPILDEAHAIRDAIDQLARDPGRRARLGEAGRIYWQTHHTLAAMAGAYDVVLRDAAATQAPHPALPRHLIASGDERLDALVKPFGVGIPAALAD